MSSVTPNYGLIKPGVGDPTDQDLWGGYLNTDMDIIDTTMKSISDSVGAPASVPLGVPYPFAGDVAPPNHAFCFGQAISRVTYSALFAEIKTIWGNGDGSTTFNLPDIRGVVIAGKNDMGGTGAGRLTGTPGGVNGDTLGAIGGNQQLTLSTGNLPNFSLSIATYTQGGGSQGGKPLGALDSGSVQIGTGTTGSIGSGTPANNVQPTVVMNYIMRLT